MKTLFKLTLGKKLTLLYLTVFFVSFFFIQTLGHEYIYEMVVSETRYHLWDTGTTELVQVRVDYYFNILLTLFYFMSAVMGLAFIQNIYGTSQMAPLMIIGTVPLYNVMAVVILSFTGPGDHELSKESLKKSILGIAKNPIIIGIVLGMIASIVRLKLPFILDKTLHNFSIMASPLALVGLGAGFEGKKAIKKIKPTVICTFVKLMVWPMLFLPVALYMGFSGEKIIAILVMLGSATTPSSYIMTKNMGHEGVLTSSTIVCTTLFSAFSLTLWLFILKSVGAI